MAIPTHRSTARRGIACLAASALALHAGVLVTRSAHGLEFADAASIAIAGKEKALSMGAQPKLSALLNKLPSTRFAGTLLWDADAGVLALDSDGNLDYLLPEGLPKNTPPDPAAIWRTTNLSYKKSASDKAPTEVAATAFVAFLPGGPADLAHLCTNVRQLELVGGKNKAFATQLEFIAATVKAFPNDTGVTALAPFVADAMRQRFDRFQNGVAGVDVLQQALELAALSAAVYPNQPGHDAIRQQITATKAWLDRKEAVLRAFAAVHAWDAFLAGDRDFARYQQAYADMQKLYTEALHQSLEQHKQTGEERYKESEYGNAYREFRLASLRQPSDQILQQKVQMAWTDYSRNLAIDRQGQRKPLNAGQREAIDQALRFATGYLEQNKLDAALKSVLQAQQIDPFDLNVLLKKAEVLGARREFAEALANLDQYDLRAVDEERKKASDLRNDLLFKRASSVDDIKTQVAKAWSDGLFHKAYDLSLEGLRAREDDADLLRYAGMTAMVVRNGRDARAYFARYLDASDTLDANPQERAEVRAWFASGLGESPADKGEPNWLSGRRLPPGVYYDPSSLAFQARIDRIDASNKLKVAFDWQGDHLHGIVPSFEKGEHVTGEKPVSFVYDDRFPQVDFVTDSGEAFHPSADPDESYLHASMVLFNNPWVDPLAVAKLSGKNVAIGIAGNHFFNPFVWDGVHYFSLDYDSAGRVSQATEIAGPKGAPLGTVLEFEWNGMQLTGIQGYQGAGDHRAKIYQRTLEYQDGRLVGEAIEGQGKGSKIKYNYNGGKLVSASCERDATLDDRSRQVVFR